jgi:hypothetical protein
MQAYEARRGTVVQVREGRWKSEHSGVLGTILWRSGQSKYALVQVLLEDGRLELFWLSDLAVVDEGIAV